MRTTFIFTPKGVGCESGSWALTTLPRANIAIDPLGDYNCVFRNDAFVLCEIGEGRKGKERI